MLEHARQIRAAVTLPLVLLGGVTDRAGMDTAMAEGFEFVAMARALLREPDLVNRISADAQTRSLCIHCNKCMPTIFSRHPLRRDRLARLSAAGLNPESHRSCPPAICRSPGTGAPWQRGSPERHHCLSRMTRGPAALSNSCARHGVGDRRSSTEPPLAASSRAALSLVRQSHPAVLVCRGRWQSVPVAIAAPMGARTWIEAAAIDCQAPATQVQPSATAAAEPSAISPATRVCAQRQGHHAVARQACTIARWELLGRRRAHDRRHARRRYR